VIKVGEICNDDFREYRGALGQEWKVWRHNPRESGETEVSESEDGDDEA